MNGCNCSRFKDAVSLFLIRCCEPILIYRSSYCIGEGELGDGAEPIDFCPFCGTKLTPLAEKATKDEEERCQAK